MNWKGLMVWWPLAVAIFGFVTYGAHADTTLAAHETRLMKIESVNVDVISRLARVEQMAADTQATSHRIERFMYERDSRP
jgi:hypothetical protein